MGTLYYSSGQAAQQLAVTQDTIRTLCHSGLMAAETTPGGQWRIAKDEIDRLKRDGLPPIPRPLPGDTPMQRAGNSHPTRSDLLGEPSAGVVSAVEDVAITEALNKKRKLERELEETEDWFRQRQREQEDRDAEEAEREAANQRAERARLVSVHGVFSVFFPKAPSTLTGTWTWKYATGVSSTRNLGGSRSKQDA